MITIEQATERFSKPEYGLYKYNHFYHTFLKMADGKSPVRCRRNGATKIWKRDKKRFEIPVKAGLKSYFYITQDNAQEWSITPP